MGYFTDGNRARAHIDTRLESHKLNEDRCCDQKCSPGAENSAQRLGRLGSLEGGRLRAEYALGCTGQVARAADARVQVGASAVADAAPVAAAAADRIAVPHGVAAVPEGREKEAARAALADDEVALGAGQAVVRARALQAGRRDARLRRVPARALHTLHQIRSVEGARIAPDPTALTVRHNLI